MEEPICIHCGGKKVKEFLGDDYFEYYHCNGCSLVFLHPILVEVDKSFLNRKMYGNAEKIGDYFAREDYYRERARKFLHNIRKYKTGGRLLDVGSSYGLFLDEAKKSGFSTSGVEIEKEAAEFSKKKFNLEVTCSSFSDFSTDRKYEVIAFIDVLEHVKDVNSTLEKTKDILKKDGVLFIQCPNIESLMFKLTGKKWTWLLPNFHVYHFSIRSLTKILTDGGFEILSVETYDDISEFSYNLIDFLGIKKRNLFEKTLWKFTRLITLLLLQLSPGWSHFGYGGLINMVARKK